MLQKKMLQQQKRGIALLPKNSLLMQVGSWSPFIQAIDQAIQAHDFTKKSIKAIFTIIDPQFDCSSATFFRKICGIIIGPGFLLGRKFLFLESFRRFIEKYGLLFFDAPIQAIEAYNRLVTVMFKNTKLPSSELDNTVANLSINIGQSRDKKSLKEQIIERNKHAQQNLKKVIQDEVERQNKEYMDRIAQNRTIDRAEEKHIYNVASSENVASSKEASSQHASGCRIDMLSLSVQDKKYITEIALNSAHPDQLCDLVQKIYSKLQHEVDILVTILQDPVLDTFLDIATIVSDYTQFQLPNTVFDSTHMTIYFDNLKKIVEVETTKLKKLGEIFIARKHRLTKIGAMQQSLTHSILPLQNTKQVHDKVSEYLFKISTVTAPITAISSPHTQDIETAITHVEQTLTFLDKEITTNLASLLFGVIEENEKKELILLKFLFKYWSCIANHYLYTDLFLDFTSSRMLFLKNIVTFKDYIEKNSYEVVSKTVSGVIDIQDIELTKKETFARSRRLKDMREGIYSELIEIDTLLLIAKIIAPQSWNKDNLSIMKALRARDDLLVICKEWIDPKTKLMPATSRETVNLLFRRDWITIEAWQKNKKDHITSIRKEIENQLTIMEEHTLHIVFKPFLFAIDSIQHMLQQQYLQDGPTQKGPTLYEKCSDIFQNIQKEEAVDVILHTLQKITKYTQESDKAATSHNADGQRDFPLNLLYQYVLAVAAIQKSIKAEIVLHKLLMYHHDVKKLKTAQQAFQTIKMVDVEYEAALLEFFDAIPHPYLYFFSFTEIAMANDKEVGFARNVLDQATRLMQIVNTTRRFLVIGLGENFASELHIKADTIQSVWHGYKQCLYDDITEIQHQYKNIFEMFFLFTTKIDSLKEQLVEIDVAGNNHAFSDLFISITQEYSLTSFVLSILAKICDGHTVCHTPIYWDCYCVVSWTGSIIIQLLKIKKYGADKEVKSISEVVQTMRKTFFQGCQENIEELQYIANIKESVEKSRLALETYFTLSNTISTLLQEFFYIVDMCVDVHERRRMRSLPNEKKFSEMVQPLYIPFLYGDLSLLQKI